MEIAGNSNNRGRILYIDTLKWFGIVLVYLGHFLDKLIPLGNPAFLWLHNFIYSFHLPLFFFLSGVFWKPEKSAGKYLARRAIILLVPALFWSLVYIPFNLTTISLQEFLRRLSNYPFGHFEFFHPSWFLVCLFMVTVILSGLSKILNISKKILLRAALIFGAFLIGFFFDEFQSLIQGVMNLEVSFWYIGETFTALGFFLTGSTLKNHLITENKGRYSSFLVLIISISLFILTSTWIIGGWVEADVYVDMSKRQYGNYFWFITIAFFGIASSFLLFKGLNIKSRFLQFIGENSIVFYLLNGFNIFVLDNFVVALGLVPTGIFPAFLFSLGYAIFSQLLLIPLAFVLVKYSPLLVGRYKFAKFPPN